MAKGLHYPGASYTSQANEMLAALKSGNRSFEGILTLVLSSSSSTSISQPVTRHPVPSLKIEFILIYSLFFVKQSTKTQYRQ